MTLQINPYWQLPKPIEPKFNKIYRISDNKLTTNFPPITKQQCFKNFINIFGPDNLIVIADNIKDSTSDFLLNYVKKEQINYTSFGNAGSLKLAFDVALTYDHNEIVYFIEDDFLHLPNGKEYLIEALERVDYATLYFHPDKLAPGPNPFITKLGEKCNVFATKSSIFKTTNSTVQTFATKVSTLKEDKDILYKYNFNGPMPDSFRTFTELLKKGRTLANPIPGRSTHLHQPWISPFVDWLGVANKYV